ncbi:hypothetical protein, partial [Streptococcus lutetiensis]|uniref:hypothetical protein n=1 Tax=Streptococcus lutetiensis TaxID=150055 RepID=UPI001BDA4B1C
ESYWRSLKAVDGEQLIELLFFCSHLDALYFKNSFLENRMFFIEPGLLWCVLFRIFVIIDVIF